MFFFAVWAGARAPPKQQKKHDPAQTAKKNKHAPAPSERVFFCCLGGWACFFLAVWAGCVFFFCCLGRGRVVFFALWTGVCFFAVWVMGVSFFLLFGRGSLFFFLLFGRVACFFLAVWAGNGSSLTYLPGSSSSDPQQKKTKQQKKKHEFTRVNHGFPYYYPPILLAPRFPPFNIDK